jgi:hypothetical protein
LLHISEHKIHPQLRTNARTFQPKARASASENGGFVFEISDHDILSQYVED